MLGAGGFIGSHMVKRLRSEGCWVRGVDLKRPEFSESEANEFIQGDLRDVDFVRRVLGFRGVRGISIILFLTAWWSPSMRSISLLLIWVAGFVFTGENDADIMHNSVQINLNVLECQRKQNEKKDTNYTKIFYSGSACMYPKPINLILIILIAVKNQHTQQTLTLNMVGRNCFRASLLRLQS